MKLHQNMEKIHSGSWTKFWGNWKQRGMLLSQPLPSLLVQTCHITAWANLAWEGTRGAPAEPKGLSAAQQLPVHLIVCLRAQQLHVSSKFLLDFCGTSLHDWEAPCVFTASPWLLSPGTSHCHRWFCFLLQGHKTCSHAWRVLGAAWIGPQQRMKLALKQIWLLSSRKSSTVLTILAQNHLHFSKDVANQCPFLTALSPPGCTTLCPPVPPHPFKAANQGPLPLLY